MNRRQGYLVGRAEFRRRVRAVTDDRRQLVAMAITGLFVAVGMVGAIAAAYFGGVAVREGNIEDPVSLAEPLGAGVLVFVGFIVLVREMNQGEPPALAGHLTTVTGPTLAFGYLLVEYAITGLFALPLVVFGSFAFGLGAADPLLGLTTLTAILGLWLLAVPLWKGFAYALQYAFARVPALARHKTAIGIAAFVAYMGVLTTGEADSVLGPFVSALAVTPAGWFAHLALFPVDGSPTLAAGALGVAAVATPLAGAATLRLADAVWHADPLPADESDAGEKTHESTGPGIEARLPISRPTAAVVRRCWRRGLRAPITLVYVPYPLFFMGPPIGQSVAAGEVVAALPVLGALYAPWAVGAAFSLNPLGDEGVVLPGTITSGVGGRRYVAGRVLAGSLVGAPLAALLVLALGAVSPLSLSGTAALAALCLIACPAAAAAAAGFGATLPNTDASTVFRSREAVLPSPWAFLGYSLVVVIAMAPALLAWYPATASLVAGDGGDIAIQGGATLLSAVIAVIAGGVGFRIAASAVDDFEMN